MAELSNTKIKKRIEDFVLHKLFVPTFNEHLRILSVQESPSRRGVFKKEGK